jgi:hypothetical protein
MRGAGGGGRAVLGGHARERAGEGAPPREGAGGGAARGRARRGRVGLRSGEKKGT